MKKPDNIDDLFARKLSNLERTPSPDLWQRIEQGKEKESRRLGGWYWYAAASVTILLMAGYLVWQNQPAMVDTQGQTARTEQVIKPLAEKQNAPDVNLSELEALANTQKVEPARGDDQKSPVKRETFALAKKAIAPVQQMTKQVPVLDDIQVAKVENTETSLQQLITETGEAVSTLQPVEVQVPGTALVDVAQKRIIVAHVDAEGPANEDQRSSKFIRVLRQLKNAKQGDEVEWDELGFNPKKILARADERLRSGEDKVSGKYQELKNKTKL